MRLVTAAQMRVLEAAAVAAGSSPAQLMEEAGLAVAQEAWMLLGTLEGRSIVVLVGPGNNGGDGIVAARHLASWGAGVIVFLPLPRPAADPLLAGLEGAGVNLMPPGGDGDALARALTGADLVVDALLGIGQSRAIDPAGPMGLALASVAEARRGYQPPKLIAVDLPSGMQADTGALDPLTVAADLTVTFGLPKVGMYQGASGEALGRVQVIDIGIPRAAQDAVTLELLTSRWARETLPPRPAGGNKGTFGRVLIVGGSMRYPGAPRLAALGAYRAGAGLVTIGCPRAVLPQLAPGLAEATWLPLPGGEDGALCGEAALALRDEWHAFDAAAIGPGVGDTEETRALTWAILPDIAASLPNGVVIDADALNAIAAMPDGAGRLPPHAVLTPHPGELSRLLGITVADVQARRLEVALEAAARFRCTVVLKGAHSVIASPDGRASLSPFANPLLATAGSGDVLAGIIAAYLGRGLHPFEAACLGVYVHAAAGESLREEMGDGGLLASELAHRLPRVVKELTVP